MLAMHRDTTELGSNNQVWLDACCARLLGQDLRRKAHVLDCLDKPDRELAELAWNRAGLMLPDRAISAVRPLQSDSAHKVQLQLFSVAPRDKRDSQRFPWPSVRQPQAAVDGGLSGGP